MTVFVHQNKFFSKEYFGSSLKIILVVFYVENLLRHGLGRRVAVQTVSVAVACWAGGLPGVTPQTHFHFFSFPVWIFSLAALVT